MGKLRVYCLKTLNKLSIYPLGNTPSAPSDKGDNEEIRVNMMTIEDIKNPEEEDREYRSGGRVGWTGHNEIIERLSNATSYQQQRATEDRPISGVRINYKRDPRAPDSLTGTSGLRILYERAQRERDTGLAAPSVSTYQGLKDECARHRETGINRSRERSFDQPQRNTVPMPPRYQARDRNRPSEKGDTSDSGQPKDPNGPGWPGGSRWPGGSGWPGRWPGNPWGPGRPGRPGGPGGPGGFRGRPHQPNINADEWDRNIKMKHPTPYNGEPDLKKFDLWTASVVHYVDVMKY